MSSSVTYEEDELDSDNPDDKYNNAKLTLMSGSGDETGDDSQLSYLIPQILKQ